jgi:hypothetical protein
MVRSGRRVLVIAASLVLLGIGAIGGSIGPASGDDPLAAEIAHWSALLSSNASKAESWIQAKQASEAMLAGAQQALRDGRRLLAVRRLAAARENLAAAAYVAERQARDLASQPSFEAEWKRMGVVLGRDVKPPDVNALAGVRPSALRALGEAALSQVHVYYDASLEYGRNTTPDSGFYYLGVAQAQREFAGLCRTLFAPSSELREPPLRSLQPEIDTLETELLAAYRPPASIDRHREFILASATLKEARELDAAGLRHGALLRYLQTVERLALLRPASGVPDDATTAARLRELETRLAARGVDHTIGRLFLEEAQADLAASERDAKGAVAATVARDVLPRYFAALEPARPPAPRPEPVLTVTLVRWPYT